MSASLLWTCQRTLTSGVLLTLLTLVTPSHAEPPAAASEAREHFAHGLRLVDQGQIAAAAAAFELAYRTHPHPAVLYNLGRAYAAMGRRVAAVDALERYLTASGALEDARKAHVEGLLRDSQARIGSIEFAVTPINARIIVDGERTVEGASATRLQLDAGDHALFVEAPGHVPVVRQLKVEGGMHAKLNITLAPHSPAHAEQGQLSIVCRVPDVFVTLNDRALGRTPISLPLLVEAGRHRLGFQRSGYATRSREITVTLTKVTKVDCELEPLPALPRELSSLLQISVEPVHSEIVLDGSQFRTRRVPIGIHDVMVEAPGHVAWRGAVEVKRGESHRLKIELPATKAYYAERVTAAKWQRTLGLVSAGTGVLLGAAATATFAVNSSRYDKWQADARDLEGEFRTRAASPEAIARYRDVMSRTAGLQRTDDVAAGLAIGAGALITMGALLWIFTPKVPRTAVHVGRVNTLDLSF
jgi:hypothetical protein